MTREKKKQFVNFTFNLQRRGIEVNQICEINQVYKILVTSQGNQYSSLNAFFFLFLTSSLFFDLRFQS